MLKRFIETFRSATLFGATGVLCLASASVSMAWQFGDLEPALNNQVPDPLKELLKQEGEIIPGDLPNPQDSLLPSSLDEPAFGRQTDRGPGQKIVVRTRFAGWKQANATDRIANVGPELRGNWVMISNTGYLPGRLQGDSDVDVAKVQVVLLNHGVVVNETRTDEKGNFAFENLGEGTYSLIGIGPNAFCAFGFNAIDYRESTADKMPSSIEVMAVANETSINLDWITYFAPAIQFRVFGRIDENEGTDDPAELYGVEGLGTHGPRAVESTAIKFHQVKIGPDGTLVGRLHQMDEINGRPVDVRAMRVMLLQNDSVANSVSVDNFGVFQFKGVAAGIYSLVAVGADGMACIGIEATGGDTLNSNTPTRATRNPAGGDTATNEAQAANGPLDVVDVALISPDAVGWLNHTAHELAYERVLNRPLPPGCPPQTPCYGDINSLYCKRNGLLRELFGGMNSYFDQVFYGESSGYGQNGQGGGPGAYGMPGGVAPGNCGGVGCGQPGCSTCNPQMPMAPGIETLQPAPGPFLYPTPSLDLNPSTFPTESIVPVPMSQNSSSRTTRR